MDILSQEKFRIELRLECFRFHLMRQFGGFLGDTTCIVRHFGEI